MDYCRILKTQGNIYDILYMWFNFDIEYIVYDDKISMLLSSMQFNKSWYKVHVYRLDIIAGWSEIVVYYNLVAFRRLETWKHPPLPAELPAFYLALSRGCPYAQDAWLISSVTLDTVPCKCSFPDDPPGN